MVPSPSVLRSIARSAFLLRRDRRSDPDDGQIVSKLLGGSLWVHGKATYPVRRERAIEHVVAAVGDPRIPRAAVVARAIAVPRWAGRVRSTRPPRWAERGCCRVPDVRQARRFPRRVGGCGGMASRRYRLLRGRGQVRTARSARRPGRDGRMCRTVGTCRFTAAGSRARHCGDGRWRAGEARRKAGGHRPYRGLLPWGRPIRTASVCGSPESGAQFDDPSSPRSVDQCPRCHEFERADAVAAGSRYRGEGPDLIIRVR